MYRWIVHNKIYDLVNVPCMMTLTQEEIKKLNSRFSQNRIQYVPQFCFWRYFTGKQCVFEVCKSFSLIFACFLLCFQMSSLLYLSPEQLVGLMFDDIPGLPEKSVVINAVFDHLTASPQKQRIVSMLPIMVESSTTVKRVFQCTFASFSHCFPTTDPWTCLFLTEERLLCIISNHVSVLSYAECASRAESHVSCSHVCPSVC